MNKTLDDYLEQATELTRRNAISQERVSKNLCKINGHGDDCEITRNCPICGMPLKKEVPQDPFKCPCGWQSDKPNGDVK